MTAKKKKTKETALSWSAHAMFGASAERGPRKLAIFVQPKQDEWVVLALETTVGGDVMTVLEDHAHKIVGFYPDIREAFDAADNFAAAWFAGRKRTKAPDCECTDIEATEDARQ